MKIFNLLLAFLIQAPLFSQIMISNVSEIEKVRNGTTYIAMQNPDAPEAQAFIEVYKKYWTISEMQFISYDEVEKHLSPEASFFTLGGYEEYFQTGGFDATKPIQSMRTATKTYVYLELWTCKDSFFKVLTAKEKRKKARKKKRSKIREIKFDEIDKHQIARIELFVDAPTLHQPDSIYNSEYDGGGHIRNWGPGFLKNYLQLLMQLLEQEKVRGLYQRALKKDKLGKLRNQPLYIPDYVLIRFGMFTTDESGRRNKEELLSQYPFGGRFLPTDELDQKLLQNEEEFYYLVYVKLSSDKIVSIMNSRTGELIYSNFAGLSYNIKSKDFKLIAKSL
ncbi:MAG: hypothetical protein AAFV95_16500 [Bacteroidota bacterium]